MGIQAIAVYPATASYPWLVRMLASGPGLAANAVIVTVEIVGIRSDDGEVGRGDIGAVEIGGYRSGCRGSSTAGHKPAALVVSG